MDANPLRQPADAVLWQEQVSLRALAPRDPKNDRRTDVIVVGGGYGGLAAAAHLGNAGRSVVVFEKGPIGWGAHSRNGGMVIPELKSGPAKLTKKYGPLGAQMHAEVHQAFDHVEALADGGAIQCDYRRSGQTYLAHTPRLVPYLREVARELHDDHGEPVHFVERAALSDEIGSDSFHGAVVYERTGSLHPARFHAGLLRQAIDSGATVIDKCAVRSFDARTGSGPRFEVETEDGAWLCDHLIIATNAYADGLLPSLRRRILPVGSFIVATEVLDEKVAAQISPKGRMFVDTKNLLFYWRLSPDGRMVFGGRRSLSHATVAEAADYLTASMQRIHPQLSDVAVTHRWGGNVAVTIDRMPHVGNIDGAWYAAGCNGSGVALNTWLGHRLAMMVTGDAGPPAFAQLTHRPIPLHRFRRAYLPAVGQWFRYQDRP